MVSHIIKLMIFRRFRPCKGFYCHGDYVLFKMVSCYFRINALYLYNVNEFSFHAFLHKRTTSKL